MRWLISALGLAVAVIGSAQGAEKKPAKSSEKSDTDKMEVSKPASLTAQKKKTSETKSPTKKSSVSPAPSSRSKPKSSSAGKGTNTSAKAPTTKPTATKPLPVPAQVRHRYDPYDLSLYFSRRWDLLHVIVTPGERTRYIAEASEKRMQQLARALTAVEDVLEQRQQNTRSAATVLYVVGRANGDAPWYPGLNRPHQAALRSVIQRDQAETQRATAIYEPLRHALNREAIEVIQHNHNLPNTDTSVQPPTAITISNIDAVVRENDEILAARSPAADALLAVIEAEQLIREQQKRETLASLAPPPPVATPSYIPLVSPETPMPEETVEKPREIPPPPPLAQPAHKGIDVPAPAGTRINAAADGVVAFAGPFRGYRSLVIVEHPGELFSVYGYLREMNVKQGDHVTKGSQVGTAGEIAESGSSGFYFEVRKGTTPVDIKTLPGITDPAQLVHR